MVVITNDITGGEGSFILDLVYYDKLQLHRLQISPTRYNQLYTLAAPTNTTCFMIAWAFLFIIEGPVCR